MMNQVLIIGAGPTGLMAAVLLKMSGIQVRVIDKNISQAHESRALGVQARTLELFHNIGIIKQVLDRGMIASGMRLVINGKEKGEITFTSIGRNDTPFPYVFFLSQSETEDILTDSLRKHGIEVERGTEAISIVQHDSKIKTVVQKNGVREEITTSFVIGADGAHSMVRKQLALKFDGAPYPQDFVLGDVKVDWPLSHDRLSVFFHGKSFGAFFPLKNKEVSRVLAINAGKQYNDLSKIGSSPVSLHELQYAFSKVTNIPTTLSNPTWLARFHIHHRGVDKYRIGNVFVGGDSAHIHSPVGAQGMNTGLQDVANLCWKMSMVLKYGSPDKLLDTYHQERWPIGQKLLNFTDRLFTLIATQNSVLIRVRDLAFRSLAKFALRSAKVRYRAFNFVSQLGIRYHDNDFIGGKSGSTLRPGMRLPNAKISNDTELFDLVTGYQFHLLAVSRNEINANQTAEIKKLPTWIKPHIISTVQVRKDEIYKTLGIDEKNPDAIFIIRPDGHISYQTDRLDMQEVRSYLSRFLPTGS